MINNTKFDLRIYVLVSSVEPLEIFVYRDGLARFCSLKSSCKSIFARITNVTMNKNSSFCNHPDKISRLISDVFDEHFGFTRKENKNVPNADLNLDRRHMRFVAIIDENKRIDLIRIFDKQFIS